MATRAKYISALSLILVFFLNTGVSAACAVSSLFHSFHHHKAPGNEIVHHSHDHSGNHGHTDEQEKSKEDCCSKSVVRFYEADKNISHTITLPPAPQFCTVLSLAPGEMVTGFVPGDQSLAEQFRRWRHPATIPDLRIVIQSFQI